MENLNEYDQYPTYPMKVEYWLTSDGRTFDNEEQAKEYQKNIYDMYSCQISSENRTIG